MSIYGSGTILLKDPDAVPEIFHQEWAEIIGAFGSYEISPDHGLYVQFVDIWAMDVEKFLDEVTKYTESGRIDCEADGEQWRYSFRNGKWIEEVGKIMYWNSETEDWED